MALKTRILVALMLLISSLGSNAATIKQVDINFLLQHSAFVFEGSVVSSEARWNAQATRIHTYVVFDIEDVIKGQYADPQLTLRYTGGTVGDTTLAIEGSVVPLPGDIGIYFIESLEHNLVNPILGWSQGHFRILKDAANVERVTTEANSAVIRLEDGETQKSITKSPFSNGIAKGMVTSRRADAMSQAITKKDFKDQLRLKLRSFKPAVSVNNSSNNKEPIAND